MGAVYLADQFEPIRRQVALKLIHAGMETGELLQRFESERDLLARMNHPNIAQVLEVGSADDGRLYFAMEYVPGVPLSEFCNRRGVDIEHRLELFLQVCEGVQHAHQKGVIHRDLKPGNIMVADYHGTQVVKVIDFGIAKGMDDFGRLDPGSTRTGTPIGTPAYMSPEQARGEPGAIDTRTDVYALGGVLYKLLTDETPITEDVLSRSTDVGLARALMDSVTTPPSKRVLEVAHLADTEWKRRMAGDPQSLARRLQGDLDWITLKALEHDRDRRYASVSELAADVKRHINGEPVLASPPSRIYRLRKLVQRHRVMAAATASVALALVAGIVGTSWMALEAEAQRSRAELAQVVAEQQRDRALATRAFLEDMIAAPDPWKLQGGNVEARNVRVVDALLDAAQRIEQSLATDPTLRGEVETLLGRTLRRLGRLDDARRRLESATATLATLEADAHPRLLADLELALVNASLGDYETADRELQRLLPLLGGADGLDDREDLVAEARRSLAEVAAQRGELVRAIGMAREHLDAAIATNGEASREASGARSTLADLLGMRGEWKEAELLAAAAHESERQRLGPAHPITLEMLTRTANLSLRRGDYEQAIQRYRQAAVTAEQVLGSEHPSTIFNLAHLATALDNAGQREAAVEMFRNVLPRMQQVIGENHADTLTIRANLGLALRHLERLEEAQAEMQDVHSLRRRVLGETHPETIRTLMFLAVIARDRGDLDRAEVLLGQAADLYGQANGRDHPETLIMENNHLSVLRERGEQQRALDGFAALSARAEAALPPDHWHLAAIRSNYGRSLGIAGRHEEAEALVVDSYRRIAAQFGAEDPRTQEMARRVREVLERAGRSHDADSVLDTPH